MGRTQEETINIRLTTEEKNAVIERMKEAASPSMRDFILRMCMDGKIVVNSDLRELNQELRYGNDDVICIFFLCHVNNERSDIGVLLT